MKYTVAICTWNRSRLLPFCVRSVAAQTAAPEYEILVVDNSSTDGTAAVIRDLMGTTGRMRSVVEPRLGLSHARNRALREAGGDVVAFLDDDAQASPGWLKGLDGAFSADVHVACAGGPVRLDLPAPLPSRLPSVAPVYFGELDFGGVVRPMTFDERPRGCNFAVRRDVALTLGGFRPELGRIGESLLSGEDDDFLNRVHAAGLQVWWAPGAPVAHTVDPSRMTLRWLLRRAWMQGRSEVTLERGSGGATARECLHAMRTDLLRSARNAGAMGMLALTGRRDWADHAVPAIQAAGRAYGQGGAALAARVAVRDGAIPARHDR